MYNVIAYAFLLEGCFGCLAHDAPFVFLLHILKFISNLVYK